MDFPNYFADAQADFNKSNFVIFGVPFGKTSSFRHGSEKAPKEIRQASWNFETYDLRSGNDISDIKIHDYENLDVENVEFIEMIETVKKFTSSILSKNKFPIAIGGQHSITPGIVQAFPKDTAVLFLDAHIDYREEYENNKFNHACAVRRVTDHIDIKNIAVLGIRSAEKKEFIDAKKLNFFIVMPFLYLKTGFQKQLKKQNNI